MTLCSTGLKVLLSSKGRNTSTRKQNDSVELKVRTATHPIWAPCASESKAKKGVAVLAGMTDLDYQGGIGLLVHSEGKYVWNSGDHLGHLLVLPCTVIKVNGNYVAYKKVHME